MANSQGPDQMAHYTVRSTLFAHVWYAQLVKVDQILRPPENFIQNIRSVEV